MPIAQTLFISDLHLCSSRPHLTALLQGFLKTTARQSDALYVLGDLFEYWAGDDDLDLPEHAPIVKAFAAFSQTGIPLYLMHGNRDFLLGQAFSGATGATILHDPILISMYGKKVLLSHGDMLCTDDTSYQVFRQQVRSAAWQTAFLSQPLSARKAQIEALRTRSESEKSMKSEAIMDVNNEAVAQMMRDYDYPDLLIHGHTHRPDIHPVTVDGKQSTRIVLADWHDQGAYLALDQNGYSEHVISA